MPKVKDLGWGHVQAAVAAAAAAPRVKVGIQGEAASAPKERRGKDADAPLSLVEIAALHEYGIGNPERSFLADTLDQERAELDDVTRRVANGVLAGRFTFARGLSILGMHHQSQVKRRIVSRIPPPNAPATIKKKGSSTPLVDTGQLLTGVTYAVQSGRGGDT